ncbi:hypothetical protein BY996DRAFT_4579229 [Phakopsora pachyrhizi]|uniref:Expressed protein n=1 Tax=Phakopsora pachyrhizi TaxID=170000 RepID=A0AAV0ANG6_PHAPC|nr:hypothetical protein BY996DRAFT_4579229 [Phakopsora pachyrhizi]CAH7669224.1 expressed protein [Phakopsora pachyrhizi]
MSRNRVIENKDPIDFHNLKARFRIPMAPTFLPRPTRTNRRRDERSDESSSSETEDSSSSSSSPQREGKSNGKDRIRASRHKNPSSSSFVECSGGAIEAVNQSLSSMLMKYIPNLGCVILSFQSPPRFIFRDAKGRESYQLPDSISRLPIKTVSGLGWATLNVEVDMLGWRPTVGQTLIGRPTHSSPSHLSLIVYKTFNASISSNHLRPADYNYDPNLDVPTSWVERGGGGSLVVDEQNDGMDDDLSQNLEDRVPGSVNRSSSSVRGCWVDKFGRVVGGVDGIISFTVISLTVANSMISIEGSLLSDPFSNI